MPYGLVAQRQSGRLITDWSQVRILPSPPNHLLFILKTLTWKLLIELLLSPEMKRTLELRNKTNPELFTLYDAELAFKQRSANALREARRLPGRFHKFLGEYLTSVVLAKEFLGQFTYSKTLTVAGEQ